MQYKVTSVFPFRKDWRADIRQVRADGTLSEERKRPVIKARSKEEARAKAEKLALQFGEESDPIVLDGLLDFAASLNGESIKAETVRGYQSVAKRTCVNLTAMCIDERISEFGKSHAEKYVASRLESGACPNTIRRELSVLNMYFSELERRGQIKDNPIKGITVPGRRSAQPIDPVKAEKIIKLLSSMQGGVGLQGWLAYSCHLHPKEIAPLLWNDFNPTFESVSVSRTIDRDKRVRSIIPIELTCCEELQIRLKSLRGRNPAGEALFASSKTGYPHPDVLAREFRSACAGFGVKTSLDEVRRLGLTSTELEGDWHAYSVRLPDAKSRRHMEAQLPSRVR